MQEAYLPAVLAHVSAALSPVRSELVSLISCPRLGLGQVTALLSPAPSSSSSSSPRSLAPAAESPRTPSAGTVLPSAERLAEDIPTWVCRALDSVLLRPLAVVVFPLVVQASLVKDRRLYLRCLALYPTSPHSLSLPADLIDELQLAPVGASEDSELPVSLRKAVKYLQSLADKESPLDKLAALVKATQALSEAGSESEQNETKLRARSSQCRRGRERRSELKSIGGDDMLPLFMWACVQARLPHLWAHLRYFLLSHTDTLAPQRSHTLSLSIKHIIPTYIPKYIIY